MKRLKGLIGFLVSFAIIGSIACIKCHGAENQVAGAHISSSNQISNGAIKGVNIATHTVSGVNISTGVNGVSADNIVNGTITGAKIAAQSIQQSNLANNCVGSNQIADNSIYGSQLRSGIVNGDKIQSYRVGAVHIDGIASTTFNLGYSALIRSADVPIASFVLASNWNLIPQGIISFIELPVGDSCNIVIHDIVNNIDISTIALTDGSNTIYYQGDYNYHANGTTHISIFLRCTVPIDVMVIHNINFIMGMQHT